MKLLSTLLVPLLFALSPSVATAYDRKACNNSPTLCSRSYSEIVHLGAHDSPFVRTPDNNFSDSGNQYFNATVQLDAGVRLLQFQIHRKGTAVQLCHTECEWFDAGSLGGYLKEVKSWLDKHESEVVTIVIANPNGIPAAEIAPAYQSSGLDKISYVHTSQWGAWPTLSELIGNHTRVVNFLSAKASSDAPYLLSQFEYVFETAFEVTDPKNYNCTPARPKGLTASTTGSRIPLMNRFLYDPIGSGSFNLGYKTNDTYASTLNGDSGTGNLKDGLQRCQKEWEKKGAFILVDFFDEGKAIEIVDNSNGVKGPVNREPIPARPTKSSENHGWGIDGLVVKVNKGERVATGQWIWEAGHWIGDGWGKKGKV